MSLASDDDKSSPCLTLEEVMTVFTTPMNSGERISLCTSEAQFFMIESNTYSMYTAMTIHVYTACTCKYTSVTVYNVQATWTSVQHIMIMSQFGVCQLSTVWSPAVCSRQQCCWSPAASCGAPLLHSSPCSGKDGDSERARLGQREGKAGTARGQGWDSERARLGQ